MEPPHNVLLAILWVLGGLGLFLTGIDAMGEALRKAAGATLRRGLSYVTRTRFHGLVVGTVVTALLQSSSASTVMLVGFINAGLMSYRQSIGLILGANIGTTVTPQFTAWKLDEYSLPILGVGFVLNFACRRRLFKQLGGAVMGFGMLFFGLFLMTHAVAEYKDTFGQWLHHSSAGSLGGQVIAFLLATLITLIVQSSAATIAMVQVLAMQGVVPDLNAAMPMILGAQLGTCITAILASLQSSLSARRAAIAHLVFNVIGVVVTVPLWHFYLAVVPLASANLSHEIANAHLATKLVNVALVLPFTTSYARFIEWIVRGQDKLNPAPMYLDSAVVKTPAALDCALQEIRRVLTICLEMTHDAVEGFLKRDEVTERLVLKREEIVDELNKAVGHYLVEASRQPLPGPQSARPALLLQIMSDVERIGDHAENIVQLDEAYPPENVRFSAEATAEMRGFDARVAEMGKMVGALLEGPTAEAAERVFVLKKELNRMFDASVRGHGERVASGRCAVIAGIVYLDLMTNLRRISNHLRNIALTASGQQPELAAHAQAKSVQADVGPLEGGAAGDDTEI